MVTEEKLINGFIWAVSLRIGLSSVLEVMNWRTYTIALYLCRNWLCDLYQCYLVNSIRILQNCILQI